MQSLSQNVNRCGSYIPLRSLHHAKDVYDSLQTIQSTFVPTGTFSIIVLVIISAAVIATIIMIAVAGFPYFN